MCQYVMWNILLEDLTILYLHVSLVYKVAYLDIYSLCQGV